MTATAEWRVKAHRLAAELAASGLLVDPAWRTAFAEVPRHVFLDDPTADLDAIYADDALLTQTASPPTDPDQQLPTSSSSQPSVMAVMLERLAVRPGMRILEIGTGTGYNAALLCHRLGSTNVASVDLDPSLADTARDRLNRTGYYPRVLAGDGSDGLVDFAPYDRILATCAIMQVPAPWITQLADGGRIVAPMAGTPGPLLVLDKAAPDEVSGRLDPYPTAFMPLRHQVEDPLGPGETIAFSGRGMPHYGTTPLDPHRLIDAEPELAIFCRFHLPGLRFAHDPAPAGDQPATVVAYTADSMAEATATPTADGTWPVLQRGPRRIWDTLEVAVATFERLGRPALSRFGVTALDDPARQYVWLDDPAGPLSWPLSP